MKLIDLGAFNGDSALHFITYPDITEIDAYEPNDQFKSIWRAISKVYPIKFINKAVYTFTGEIDFYLRPGEFPLGSTLMESKIQNAPAKKVSVPCVDILEILPDKEYCLKVDVEGAEYDILERIINYGNPDLIDRLYVEWHDSKMTSHNSIRQSSIISYFGNRIKTWI